MWELFGEKGEKKVEYIELVYDLIFVYLLGRSNELLFHMQGGFFTFQTYVTFLYSTLVILQVWYFSSLYINRYGSNSAADYIGLFINMYLLYYLAEGIRGTDMSMYPQYNAAWALILLNLAVQYFRQLRHVDADRAGVHPPFLCHGPGLLLGVPGLRLCHGGVRRAGGLPGARQFRAPDGTGDALRGVHLR